MATREISRRISAGVRVNSEELRDLGTDGERPSWAPAWPHRPPQQIELAIDKSDPNWWRKPPVPRPVTLPPPPRPEELLPSRPKSPYESLAEAIDGLARQRGRPVKQNDGDVKMLFKKYGVALRQPHKKKVFALVGPENKLKGQGNPQFIR
jgi:hypothetical protein